MKHRARKTLALTGGSGTVIFDVNDITGEFGPGLLIPGAYRNFIDVCTPLSPTAGVFRAYVELAENAGFHKITDLSAVNISEIDATKTGAQVLDGDALNWEFYGPVWRIKIIAVGVLGPTEVTIEVKQFTN